jgi:hypothetical protein
MSSFCSPINFCFSKQPTVCLFDHFVLSLLVPASATGKQVWLARVVVFVHSLPAPAFAMGNQVWLAWVVSSSVHEVVVVISTAGHLNSPWIGG